MRTVRDAPDRAAVLSSEGKQTFYFSFKHTETLISKNSEKLELSYLF